MLRATLQWSPDIPMASQPAAFSQVPMQLSPWAPRHVVPAVWPGAQLTPFPPSTCSQGQALHPQALVIAKVSPRPPEFAE